MSESNNESNDNGQPEVVSKVLNVGRDNEAMAKLLDIQEKMLNNLDEKKKPE